MSGPPPVDHPDATFCGCCGRQTFPRRTRDPEIPTCTRDNQWCTPCAVHLLSVTTPDGKRRYPWDRTFAAAVGFDCPFQVGSPAADISAPVEPGAES